MITNILVLFFLFWNAWRDWRTRTISLISLVICMSTSIVFRKENINLSGAEQILGCIPGICMGILSVLTRGQIGFGDALVICTIGWILGWRETIWIILWAWIGTAVIAGILLSQRKRVRIPFIPFVLLGYVTELIVNTIAF